MNNDDHKKSNLLVLRDLSELEFNKWRASTVQDYADAGAKSGRWEKDSAAEKAEEETLKLLPDGVNTNGHYIYGAYLEDALNQLLGSVWIGLRPNDLATRAFIYDITIDEAFQGKGYGRQLLALAELKAKKLGAEVIALHVFGYNDRAVKLYQTSGFKFDSHFMSKSLD